jgi:hypothetical protein
MDPLVWEWIPLHVAAITQRAGSRDQHVDSNLRLHTALSAEDSSQYMRLAAVSIQI